MPYADSALTARAWATEAAVRLWLMAHDGSLSPALAVQLDRLRDTGAVVSMVSGAPSPRAFVEAAWASGLDDLRRVGVIGGTRGALESGHQAGLGAIVGLIADARADRRPLLPAQPDRIVPEDELAAALDAHWGPARALRQRVLLNPGPTVVSDRVHRAIAGPDLCHREPEVSALLEEVRALLLRVVDAPAGWRAVLLGGSGTAAMEAMVVASVRPGERLLCIRNGTYGDRLATMAERAGISHRDVWFDDTQPADIATVSAALAADDTIRAVTVVHHETTTGLLNPLPELAAVARRHGVRLVVDAISAIGSEELALRDGGIDLVVGTANKCLHGLPGVAFVLLSPEAQEVARASVPRSVYLDLHAYLDAADRSSVPFTPSTPAILGLRAALEELLDEGTAERRAAYRERMDWLDAQFLRLGLDPVVPERHRSASVRALRLPVGISYPELHDRLKAAGFVIYAGQGAGATGQFRVCALGAVSIDALRPFVAELEAMLAPVLA